VSHALYVTAQLAVKNLLAAIKDPQARANAERLARDLWLCTGAALGLVPRRALVKSTTGVKDVPHARVPPAFDPAAIDCLVREGGAT
jgi:hypothetical protein